MNTNESLEQKIESMVERLVREHLVTLEAAAATAVREGFRRATRPAASKERAGARPSSRRALAPRRSAAELARLAERLYAAICAQPGETMAVLGRVVGASARELSRPATALRRSGRVRSVGQRHATRYFPLGA